MPFSIIKLILLFAWFLSGLYALQLGGQKLGKTFTLYNFFALFLGPFAILLCYTKDGGLGYLKDIISKKGLQKKKAKEAPVTIMNTKGNTFQPKMDAEAFPALKQLIYDALQKKCTDIFIDPKNDGYSVKYRIDGAIRPMAEMKEAEILALTAILKNASGMDPEERKRPQNGSFNAKTDREQASFRVASIGVFGGEKISIRVLAAGSGQKKLDNLGFSQEQYQWVSNALKAPSGLILVCGPKESGKSTTMSALIGAIDANTKSVISIEDPVEQVIPNISQMEVNSKTGLSFVSLLKSALTQNPDIICLSDLRDAETAQAVFQAAKTGHLMLGVFRSNDAMDTLERLKKLQVTYPVIASGLHMIIHQQLVRNLCPHCRARASLSPDQQEFLMQYGISPEKVFAPKGCPSCEGSGYSGTTALFEILIMDAGFRAILESPNVSRSSIEAYMDSHTNSANIAGQVLLLIGDGVTSYEEFERITANAGA